MTNKPQIAIPIPTSFDQEYNDRCWPQYAAAIEQSGGDPVAVSLSASPAEIADLVTRCQGILLPGSPADVNPEKYGEERQQTTAPTDVLRENVDELLLQDAHNLHKPILGICFGMQILNVWRNGSLIQDLETQPTDHAVGPGTLEAHTISIVRKSVLYSALDLGTEAMASAPRKLIVNTSHHQAVRTPGDNLLVSARSSEDDVIEAVEVLSREGAVPSFIIGVQWHPERTFFTDPRSRALFTRFVREAGDWVLRSIGTSVA